MKKIDLWRFVVAAVVLLLAAPRLHAQSTFRPGDSRLRVGDWTLVPIEEVTPISRSVHSLLALRSKDAAVGSNLVAVWYLPPAAGTQQWSAKTWDTTEHWDAIKTIKENLSIADGSDVLWPTTDQLQPWNAPKVASKYRKGFKQEDVLLAAVDGLPNRDQVLDAFTGWGYKSANPSFEKTSNAYSADTFLSGVKSAFEATYAVTNDKLDSRWDVFKAQLVSVLGADQVDQLVAQGARPIAQATPVAFTLPSNCTYFNTPAWRPGTPERDPNSDRPSVCGYIQPHEAIALCRGWIWDDLRKYRWDQNFTCPNPNQRDCPAKASCSTPFMPSTPAPGTPVKKLSYYSSN
jgi:hypothetical protein